MSSEKSLDDFFQADGDAIPPRDPAFRIAVMGRIARQRFQIELALETALFAALTICLTLLWPVLGTVLLSVGRSMTDSLAIVILLAVLAFAGRWAATHRLHRPHWLG